MTAAAAVQALAAQLLHCLARQLVRWAKRVGRERFALEDPLVDDDAPMFARSGYSGLFGKIDPEPINGLRLPTEVKDRLRQQAAEAGLNFHEFVRERLTISAFSRQEIEDRFKERLDAIEGKVQE